MIEITNIHGVTFSSASNANEIYSQTKDKNIFEEVIDTLIIEKYSDSDTTEYIRQLPLENKRIAILSLISDDNTLWNKISEIVKDRSTGYKRLQKIYFLLRDYVKIADVERKKHGEILTPFKELAEPMVKLVEKYDTEFWKNPEHKVLDSSAGYGTFLILAAYKFMVGLKDWEPDEEKRFKWIVENCLYYGELQARSVFSWLVAIDPYDEYKTNTYWGSFLTEDFDNHAKNVWGIERWDLIIQNPPYQMQKEGYKKTQPLWHLFVQKSLSILTENGYMVMVHPGGWRNVDGVFKSTQNLLKNKQILYLKLHSFRQGQEYFDAAINFDYYILKNINNNNNLTEIHDVSNKIEKIDISKIDFISDENIIEIQNLVAKSDEDKVTIVYSRTIYGNDKSNMSKTASDKFIFPCVYTVKSPDKNNQLGIWYSSENKGHFGIPKVIFASGASGVFIDKEGKFGIMNFGAGIEDKVENLENIQKALLSEKFIRNIMGFKHSLGDKYNKKIISTFRKDFWKEFIE